MYMMHGFVAEDIALKTFDDDFAVEGLNDSTVDNSSNSYTQKEILEKTETILDARKVCCRTLRSLEKQLDKRHSVLTKAGSYALYHHFRNRDRRKASQLTSERGVKFLLGSEYARDELIVFALHQQLMSSPDMFLANSREMRDESNFSVQPLDSLIALKTVRSWISQDSVEMRSFVSKCQAIVLARRHHEASKSLSSFSSSSSSALHFSSKKFPPWTESDLIFIRVFRNIAVNQRMIQDQPYSTVVASILKKIGLYDERAMDENWPSLTFDRFGAIALLKDLGILPTWQTVGIWDPDLNIENRIFEKLRTSSVKESSRAIEPSPASTDSQSLKSNKKPGVGSKGENKLISDLCDELRHDFGNLAVYIIDDLEAQELDDGISIEMIDQVSTIDEKGPGMLQAWIHIHVADPSAHLDPSDSVSLRARTYLESVYLPGFSLPMIPSDFIGSNRMSLGSSGSVEGSFSVTTGQRTLTFSAKVDESGNLLEYKVRPGLIRNSKLITYQTVAEILDGTPSAPSPQVFIGSRLETASSDQQKALGRLSSKDLDETDLYKIKQLGRFSKCLTGRRVDDGAISWQLPIAHASIPSNNPHLWPSVEISRTPRLLVGNPTVSVTFPSKIEDLKTHGWGITSSQGLVTEMMLLAGRIAGRFYADRRLAGDKILLPFRSQPSPEKIGSIQNQATLRELKRRVNPQTGLISPFDFQKSRIIFMPAVNGLEPMTHFPLGIDDGYGYCRVTSPLRRYGDLLAHWQIKNSILRWAGKRTYEDSQKVLSEKMMVEFIGRLDRESKPVVNLCRKSNLSWITYVLRRLIKSSKEDGRDDDLRSFGIDEIEEMIERRLTAVIFQDPVLMRYTNRWSIKTYVPELGLKASLLVDGIEDWFSGWSVGDRIRDDVYPGDFHDVLKKGSCVITPFESDDPVGLRLPVKIKFINEDDHIILKFDRDRIDTIQQTVS
ncbi:exonuclease for RNA 3 [Phakopsora pachyrhizi]|uniref:Exonuclease for RNA 3 n=1 Tax=Phakopsora pachyrhizi TaxID=170000 RepID=A0AAV0AH27_PHAPC|nr:exonuclease for RNA 3 [Phakopsora pachyrhizi]